MNLRQQFLTGKKNVYPDDYIVTNLFNLIINKQKATERKMPELMNAYRRLILCHKKTCSALTYSVNILGKALSFLLITLLFFLWACSTSKSNTTGGLEAYSPESKALYDSIVTMDSVLFNAYNTCNLEQFEALISEDLEFYHDQGGLTTSKKELVQAFKNNICGKVTRELLKGSIEVYPIPNYGAVQMGAHRFYNNQEKERGPSRFSKFVSTWHKENGQWKLARVISLH